MGLSQLTRLSFGPQATVQGLLSVLYPVSIFPSSWRCSCCVPLCVWLPRHYPVLLLTTDPQTFFLNSECFSSCWHACMPPHSVPAHGSPHLSSVLGHVFRGSDWQRTRCDVSPIESTFCMSLLCFSLNTQLLARRLHPEAPQKSQIKVCKVELTNKAGTAPHSSLCRQHLAHSRLSVTCWLSETLTQKAGGAEMCENSRVSKSSRVMQGM